MAKEPLLGLTQASARKLQTMLREWNRFPRNVVAQRRNPSVQNTGHRFYFRNDSGETIPAGGVMRKTGTELVDGVLTQIMNKPTTVLSDPYCWHLNLGRAIPSNEKGWCSQFEDEAGLGYYLSGTIAVGDWWGPKPSQWNLERYHLGFRIHGNDANGLVYVEQQIINPVWGTLDGSLSQGSSATMSVFCHNGSSWVDTTFNATVYDRLMKTGATAIASGKWVVADYYSGRWFAQEAECA